MNEYPTLIRYLKFKKRREVAKQITKAVGRGSIDLSDEALATQLLIFIEPVLKKQPDYVEISELLFKDEQIQVAKMIYQIHSDDPAVVWEVLKKFVEKFLEGGE